MMKRKGITTMKLMRMGLMCAVLVAGAAIGRAEAATADDPTGIIKKPIPDKTVVFTFDDGCASHATVAAPILKKHGFSGTFYVSDAYGFRERKDWYMTWRQIKGHGRGWLRDRQSYPGTWAYYR